MQVRSLCKCVVEIRKQAHSQTRMHALCAAVEARARAQPTTRVSRQAVAAPAAHRVQLSRGSPPSDQVPCRWAGARECVIERGRIEDEGWGRMSRVKRALRDTARLGPQSAPAAFVQARTRANALRPRHVLFSHHGADLAARASVAGRAHFAGLGEGCDVTLVSGGALGGNNNGVMPAPPPPSRPRSAPVHWASFVLLALTVLNPGPREGAGCGMRLCRLESKRRVHQTWAGIK